MELGTIFAQIKSYQKAMGYDFDSMTVEERMETFRNYILAMQVEQVELLQELPWKPWRPVTTQTLGDKRNIVCEWVDCLFFLVDQALCLGFSAEEAIEAYDLKMKINLDRINTGYNHIKTSKKEKAK